MNVTSRPMHAASRRIHGNALVVIINSPPPSQTELIMPLYACRRASHTDVFLSFIQVHSAPIRPCRSLSVLAMPHFSSLRPYHPRSVVDCRPPTSVTSTELAERMPCLIPFSTHRIVSHTPGSQTMWCQQNRSTTGYQGMQPSSSSEATAGKTDSSC